MRNILFVNLKRWKRRSRKSRLFQHSRLATPVRLRAGEFVKPSTPLWYMLIAITPRVRYQTGARCSAWRATELRQLCANLLNSNLTGSHLPPLVRAATAVPSQAGSSTWNWIIPPFRDSSRGCTRTYTRDRERLRILMRVYVRRVLYIFACQTTRNRGKRLLKETNYRREF